MNLNERNKQVKTKLSAIFGRENVSVKGGRGTAYGWCEVHINGGKRLSNEEFYNQAERDLMNDLSRKAKEAIKGIEFYKWTDDMGFNDNELLIQVSLD
jgi:hypothetical protein